MSRRSSVFVAVAGLVALIGVVGPFAGRLGAPSVTPTPTPAVTPRVTLHESPPGPAVALDLADASEADALRAELDRAGWRVEDDASARIGDTPAEGASRYVVVPWALVVHPRALVLDLTLEEAVGLMDSDSSWQGLLGTDAVDEDALRLVVQSEAASWMDAEQRRPTQPTEALTADDVLDTVASEPGTVGLVDARLLDPRVRALTVEGWDPYRDPADAAPFAQARWVQAPSTAEADALAEALGWLEVHDPAGFLATGELIPARCVHDRLVEHPRGWDAMFDGTRDLIQAADLAMSHWEPSIVDAVATPCTPTFNMSTVPEAAAAAARAGVDVTLAVGNHLGDCWSGCGYTHAVMETLEHLRAAGLLVTGAGPDLATAREPVVLEVDGVTFAILAYDAIAHLHYGATEDTPGTAGIDEATLAEDVRAAKARADHVVVGFSWGVEYVAVPSLHQQEAARIAVEAGASLVVGNHPHWVQATEWVDTPSGGDVEDGGAGRGFVAYSLGNFVFDQDWSVETTQGAVLEVGFTRDRILGVRLRPTAVRAQHLVEWVPPATVEGRAILGRIWDASGVLAR